MDNDDASDSIGTVLLDEFQKEPSFTLTILQRASSKFQPPRSIKLISIPGSHPTEEHVAAFEGQDVVVNCMTTLSVADQFRMVDAAIAAGVRRYVPSEYGLDNTKPEAQALNVVFHDKGKVQEYIRSKAADGAIEWMSIACGIWLEWGMAHDFIGNTRYFSYTTEENTAVGLIKALKKPQETKNTNVFLSDFAITQKQLLADAFIGEKQEAVRGGDQFATFALIETGFTTGRFGGHLEKEPGVIWNEKLGLPKHALDEVVADALGSL
ncbi:NmrA-like family protein [Hypoxylon sp. FL1150]|nr:NmrA-like family protein [Hypoxylon sp. FL1150]